MSSLTRPHSKSCLRNQSGNQTEMRTRDVAAYFFSHFLRGITLTSRHQSDLISSVSLILPTLTQAWHTFSTARQKSLYLHFCLAPSINLKLPTVHCFATCQCVWQSRSLKYFSSPFRVMLLSGWLSAATKHSYQPNIGKCCIACRLVHSTLEGSQSIAWRCSFVLWVSLDRKMINIENRK